MSTTSFGQADAFSRLMNSNRPIDEDCIIAEVSFEAEAKRVMSDVIEALPVTTNIVQDATLSDYKL